MRKTLAENLLSLTRDDSSVLVLLGDIGVGQFIDQNGHLPDRVFNVGILEQSMISLAAGLSREGFNVFVYTISPFLIERAFEQIKLDLVYNSNPVTLVGANGPFEYAKLGPTHHCPNDVPLLSLLDGVEIHLPSTVCDLRAAISLCSTNRNLRYIRLTSRTLTTHIPPNEIIHCQASPASSCFVFVGEAAALLSEQPSFSGESDILRLISPKLSDQLLLDLGTYQTVYVFEPYSAPITAEIIRRNLRQLDLNSFVYPKAISEGVFEAPHFIKV